MVFESRNPATDELLGEWPEWDGERLERTLGEVAAAQAEWAHTSWEERAACLQRVAAQLRDERQTLGELITREMGKRLGESLAEIDKCAWVCDYYAAQAAEFLQDEPIESDAGHSYVHYQPLGTVLAVMPWNFPFWQVFRFAAPALMAGNGAVLKHASNVPQCALAIEALFHKAGLPANLFRTLMIGAGQVAAVIGDARVQAVSLTGSDAAGRAVAAAAGAQLKKCVLELGGSDAFVVLEDADLDLAVEQALVSRFLNSGQSCIAAKRFIVVEAIAEAFLERFKVAVEGLQAGDPMDEATTLAPLARADLCAQLHRQVSESLAAGALKVTGCEPLPGTGTYYRASILDRVEPGMRAYSEELFGPVAVVIRARDEAQALQIANDSPFGLGASVWTADSARGERLARQVESGCCFVNGMVKSDPRLPFGGIKQSGFGRELSHHGIHEFVNAKTIWVR